MDTVTETKPKVFISYAHADGRSTVNDFWELLSSYLNNPSRSWNKWDDRGISVGQEWDNTILQALDGGCNCCLLLVSDLFGKSSYIVDKEWPKTLKRYEEQGILFFPVTFGGLEGGLASLPEGMDKFQVYWPSVSDIFDLPPLNVSNPDQTRLCYKQLLNYTAEKERFLSRLAIQMNYRFDMYLREQAAKAATLPSQPKVSQPDLRQFITDASDEDTVAKAMFGSFSYEKRYRDSSSKNHYFLREVDTQLDESLNGGDWVILEGHPLAGKTRAVFEAIKRLMHSGHSFALWPFKMPEQASQPLIPPIFPEADYRIVWMDDFDARLRDLVKQGYGPNEITLFLERIADNNLILVATARTGPAYYDLRSRFGLDDHLWDKLESLRIDRLSGKEEKAFFAWYRENFDEILSDKFDHHPGSLFLDLKAMRTRWRNMDNIVHEHGLKFNSEHAKDLLKAMHVFYVMEAYGAGGFFVEKDIQFYLQQKFKHQESFSAIGIAFSKAQWVYQPFADNEWETLIEFLSQDRFHLGFLRREGDYLVTETAYLDYIVAPNGERNIVQTLERIFSKEERLSLGLLITSYNFAEAFLKNPPRNEKQLENLTCKLKPLGLERDIQVWNQLIGLCPTFSLARRALESLKSKDLKPNYLTYVKLIQKTNNIDVLRTITQEMIADDIALYANAYEKLVASIKDYQIAQELVAQMKAIGVSPNIRVYYRLLQKTPDYETGRLVLDEMKTAGVIPNVITYEGLLQKVPDYETGRLVLEEMKTARVIPNHNIYERLLEKVPNYETGRLVLEEMKTAGVIPNASTYYHLLQKVSDYEAGRLVLDEMKTAGGYTQSQYLRALA
jgi:TIR domain/Pentatricopeptide repeat domain